MAICRMIIKSTDKPSEQQLEIIDENKNKPILFDEDSPEMTDEMLLKFHRVFAKEEVSNKNAIC